MKQQNIILTLIFIATILAAAVLGSVFSSLPQTDLQKNCREYARINAPGKLKSIREFVEKGGYDATYTLDGFLESEYEACFRLGMAP